MQQQMQWGYVLDKWCMLFNIINLYPSSKGGQMEGLEGIYSHQCHASFNKELLKLRWKVTGDQI